LQAQPHFNVAALVKFWTALVSPGNPLFASLTTAVALSRTFDKADSSALVPFFTTSVFGRALMELCRSMTAEQ